MTIMLHVNQVFISDNDKKEDLVLAFESFIMKKKPVFVIVYQQMDRSVCKLT